MKVYNSVAILTLFILYQIGQIHPAPTSENNSTERIQQSRITVSNIRRVKSDSKGPETSDTRVKVNTRSRTQNTVGRSRTKQTSRTQSAISGTASASPAKEDIQKTSIRKTSSTKVTASRPTVMATTTTQAKASRVVQENKIPEPKVPLNKKEFVENSDTKLTIDNKQINQKDSTVNEGLNSQKSNIQAQDTTKIKQKSKESPTAMTTTEAPVTDSFDTVTSWDGSSCSSRFRPHPVDKTKFEAAFTENVFENIYQSCPMSLVWRQELCRCGWPEPEAVESESCNCCNQGLKAHPKNPTMYQRLVNGQWIDEICSNYDNNQIWDNENCTCIWDPKKPQSHKAPVFKGAILPRMMTKCMNLVNMTLDEGLKDANGRDLRPIFGGNRIRVVDETGDIGKSIEIRRAPFKLGIFNGNDLQATVYFKFNFKVHDTRVRQRRKMVILSNGCRRRWQRKSINPSLEVSFFPANETFEVKFSTTAKTVVEYMRGQKDQNGWYQCVLYLQDRILNFKVNGQKIYSTNGMSGGVKSTDCPLTVAGSPTDAKNHFDGYLDELQIVKQCKYEPDEV